MTSSVFSVDGRRRPAEDRPLILTEHEPNTHPNEKEGAKCPRCESRETKFCYYNNYNTSQPRHFCRACRRYWTLGGSLRNVPIGGSTRNKRLRPNPNPSPPPASCFLPLEPFRFDLGLGLGVKAWQCPSASFRDMGFGLGPNAFAWPPPPPSSLLGEVGFGPDCFVVPPPGNVSGGGPTNGQVH